MSATHTGTDLMTHLVADVARAVRRHRGPELTLRAVSDALGPYLGSAGLIRPTQRGRPGGEGIRTAARAGSPS